MRVVIGEDMALLREGLAALVTAAGHEVVGQGADRTAVLDVIDRRRPDVAIVDVRMPPTFTDEGIAIARAARDRHPQIGILIVSQHLVEEQAAELLAHLESGVGYLLKQRITTASTLLDALERVHDGGLVLDPEVVSVVMGRRRRQDPLEALTPREREVLELMAEGRSNRAIAQAMVITEHAVAKYATSIFDKLELPSRGDDNRRVLAVLAWLRSTG